MTQARLDRLDATLQNAALDALALNPGPTLTWLTGLHFHLMERPVVMLFAPGQDPAIVLPVLETPKLAALGFPVQAFPYGEDPSGWDDSFRQAAQSLALDGKNIGVEPLALRLMEFGHIRASAPEADFPDASDAVAALRVRKDADEIAKMRIAVKIAQGALEATLPLIRIGMTEQELANELVARLLRHGSQPECPSAPLSAVGQVAPTRTPRRPTAGLRAGDLLVVDWGATHGGYLSDLTRTFAVGEVEPEYRRIHEIVQQSNAAGRAAGGPGIACAEVDKAARAVIEQAGYGQYFTHRTGHGLGMETHENPYVRGDNMQLLEPGMVYTVEPGIYLTDRNGVRIEDNVLVTQSGVESLSDMPREIRVVG